MIQLEAKEQKSEEKAHPGAKKAATQLVNLRCSCLDQHNTTQPQIERLEIEIKQAIKHMDGQTRITHSHDDNIKGNV